MSAPASLLHELYERRDLHRFSAFLSGNPHQPGGSSGGGNAGASKGKQAASHPYGRDSNGGASYGSLSRSPRFGGFMHGNAHDMQASKEEVNARDRLGRTVLHIVATDGGDAIESHVAMDAALGRKLPLARAPDKDAAACLEYLGPLLASPNVNVNLQDRENGWTALHRAVYAGNLVAARRLLQHHDTDAGIRDVEGLTAFDLLNSTLLGTNPLDPLDNMPDYSPQKLRRELVTWGANRNFVLGLQGDGDRTFPERVPLDRIPLGRPGEGEKLDEATFEPLPVRKVAMEKLHSGLLTEEKKNNFRLCGFGSTTGRLGHSSPHPQFAFEPLKDFSAQTVTDFALGQDHTILCTDKGDVWTFGSNTFSVLGYPIEIASNAKGVAGDEAAQPTPKRLVGILKKEFVIGVAASRYHSAAFTADSLFTWGKNNGQLGYSTLATPIQPSPRKVTAVTAPIKQMCATEVATVCLLEGGEVLVLHRDSSFRLNFPMTRFAASVQVYRPPSVSSRPTIFKVAGSGSTFLALSSMGDVFSWQLDNPSMEVPNSTPTSGRDVKPFRIWEDRKTFTAVTDACIANDTIVIATRSGHVYVRSRKKELTSIKGFELRTGGPANAMTKRGAYKFSRISNLQRVVGVAISSSGGFAAIRADAPLLTIRHAGDPLADSLLSLLPYYRRLTEEDQAKDRPTAAPTELDIAQGIEDDDDDSIEQDFKWLDKICSILSRWDETWQVPSAAGSDIVVVAGKGGVKVPAHSTILSARSSVIADELAGRTKGPLRISRNGTTTLLLPGCSHLTALLLLHYIYSDTIPAIYDGRLHAKIHAAYPDLIIQVADIKSELQQIAQMLQLPALTAALRSYGKAIPTSCLGDDLQKLSSQEESADVILETDHREFLCHSVVLRCRSPFFAAMFDDPDWYAPRLQSEHGHSDIARIDMKHIRADIVELVLRHLYTDTAEELLSGFKTTRIEEKLDHVMVVMSAANELLLDRLKSVCSLVTRPLVNMQTVCSVLCEAIYFEASDLQECCMQYICCNIETMLEQRLLDILPLHALERLSTFCKRRQMARYKRTARSGFKLANLRIHHAEWLRDMDVAKQTGGYRRYARRNSARSPRLSPANFSASLRLSPNLATSPPTQLLSPELRPVQPPSPVMAPSPGPSPLVAATNSDDADLFEMEDLSLDEAAAVGQTSSVSGSRNSVAHSSAPSPSMARVPWQKPSIASVSSPQSLRDIMSQADGPPGRKASANGTPDVQGPAFLRLSQRDRKRQQQVALGQQNAEAAESTPSPSSSPWRPMMPAAWKPPETSPRPSLASIQASEIAASSSRVPQLPIAPRRVSGFAQPSPAPSSPAGKSALPGLPANPASAVGAPVITPTRLQPKRNISDSHGPPERRSQDVAWVNYASTTFVPPPVVEEGEASQSFAHIQNLQATEREAIRSKKGPMSLAEIQQEENKRREEAEFLAWFEEESRKTQAELGIKPTGESRNGRGGRGRGRGDSRGGRGSSSGSHRGRGRGSGNSTPKKGQANPA